MFANAQQAKF